MKINFGNFISDSFNDLAKFLFVSKIYKFLLDGKKLN